ncbi:hypothetical protein ABZX75_29500 [Streptomyces sp. NPDC003038]
MQPLREAIGNPRREAADAREREEARARQEEYRDKYGGRPSSRQAEGTRA